MRRPPWFPLWLALATLAGCAGGVDDGFATTSGGLPPPSGDAPPDTDTDSGSNGDSGTADDSGSDGADVGDGTGDDSTGDDGTGDDGTGDTGDDGDGSSAYGQCDAGCPNGTACMQDTAMFTGSFCSPSCSDGAVCPPSPGSAGAQAACVLGGGESDPPSRCALTCSTSANDCPEGMTCVTADTGTMAICTWPM